MPSLPRGSRRLVGIGLLVAALAACTPVPLYTNLAEQQVNELMAVLLDAGIDARKMPSKDNKSWGITVRNEQIPQAMKLLTDLGLPREQKQTLGQVFQKKGFVSSGLELKARYLFGLSQELERTLGQIDDVISARVHIALPERDVVKGVVKPSSASVVLITRNGAEILTRETDIKAIVKDSIEGLDDINKVTVKFFTTAGSQLPEATPVVSANYATSIAGVNSLVLAAAGLLLFIIGGPVLWYWRRRFKSGLPADGNDGR